jgi:hypothetical protein
MNIGISHLNPGESHMSKNNSFQYGSETEIKKRASLVQKFLLEIISPEEQPIFVSDDATVFDISSDDESVLLSKIINTYNVTLSNKDLHLKVWQLIDLINKKNA